MKFLKSNSGKFVAFEGLDGSGQSTQTKLLADYLKNKGFKVFRTKEPTKNSKAGKLIREILDKKEKVTPKKLQKLFAEDRKWHLKNEILPALKKNKIVISDRYFFSSFAYGQTSGLDFDWLVRNNNNFLVPDLTFFLAVLPKTCINRIKKRGSERTLFEEREKLEKVYKNFKKVLKKFPNVKIINGEKSIKKVFADIKKYCRSLFA